MGVERAGSSPIGGAIPPPFFEVKNMGTKKKTRKDYNDRKYRVARSKIKELYEYVRSQKNNARNVRSEFYTEDVKREYYRGRANAYESVERRLKKILEG